MRFFSVFFLTIKSNFNFGQKPMIYGQIFCQIFAKFFENFKSELTDDISSKNAKIYKTLLKRYDIGSNLA